MKIPQHDGLSGVQDKPTTTPTPETDAVTFRPTTRYEECVAADFARKLERERDEARKRANDREQMWHKAERESEYHKSMWEGQINRTKLAEAELTQLRKVCDAFNYALITETAGQKNRWEVIESYSTLPHVIKANGKKQVNWESDGGLRESC